MSLVDLVGTWDINNRALPRGQSHENKKINGNTKTAHKAGVIVPLTHCAASFCRKTLSTLTGASTNASLSIFNGAGKYKGDE